MTPQQIATKIRDHFDPQMSSLLKPDPQMMLDVLGVTFTASELIQLAGAPVDSVVTMEQVAETEEPPGPFDPPQKVERIPGGLLLTVHNSRYINGFNKVVLFNEMDGTDNISLYIKLVRFHPRTVAKHMPQGVGALMLRSMLDGVRNLARFPRKFSRMTMMAAGGRNWGKIDGTGERWSGYAVWPKYGFDRNILALTRGMFAHFPYHPENLSACRKVSDLLALNPGGPEFWSVVGDGWYMDFDMALGSTAESRLSAYLGGLP